MRIKEQRVFTRDIVVRIVCDMCQRTCLGDGWGDSWEYTVAEVIIQLREGKDWPSGSDITKTSFDICPTCFKEKLVPWFESQGVSPTIQGPWDSD